MGDDKAEEESIKIPFYEQLPSRNLVFATFIVILGSAFHLGYNAALLNVPLNKLAVRIASILEETGFHNMARSEIMIKLIWSSFNAVYYVGGALGTVITVAVIDKYDRGRVIYVTCILSIFPIFAMIVAFFTDLLYPMVIARFMVGIISGVFSCSVPIYLSEIAPVSTRGMVCACFSIFKAAGVVVAYACTNTKYGGDNQWLFIIMLPVIPIIFQFIFMGHCRSSPRFLLIKKRQYDHALKSLQWFRRTEHVHLLEQELDEISQELLDPLTHVSEFDQWRYLFDLKYMGKPMLISIMVMCAQQFSGVSVFLLYSTALFEEAGVPLYFCHAGTITMGGVLLFMSILSMVLMEVTGRRMLMLYGYAGISVFTFMLYLTYLYNKTLEGPLECIGAVAGLFIWFVIIHFGLGPNSVPWILIPEMFNQAFRPKAVTIAAFCYWMANTAVALCWPLTEVIGPQLFLLNFCMQLGFFCLLYKYLPETSNKTITEISVMYN